MPVDLVIFDGAGKAFDALKSSLDIGFLAIEPVRAAEVDFTAPYVLIEGTYMVPQDSPLKAVEDVDRAGVRIAIGRGSAYDLYLTRTLKNATLVRAATGGCCAMIDLFRAEKLDAVAGVRQTLMMGAAKQQGLRVMGDAFQVIRQASGVPKGRDAAARYLSGFIDEMKANGFVKRALEASGNGDVTVPN